VRHTNGVEALAPIPTDEWLRVEQAYREIQRRDDQAEHRAWRWERFALVVVGLWVVTLAWIPMNPTASNISP
jgi:hypothetical protein